MGIARNGFISQIIVMLVISYLLLQYSNMYVTLPKLQELLTNVDLQKECLEYVAQGTGAMMCIMVYM